MTTRADPHGGDGKVPRPPLGAIASGPDLPVLTTSRLLLRGFRLEDADAVRRQVGDPRVVAATLYLPRTDGPGKAEGWIATHRTDWVMGKGAILAVTRQPEGTVVGAISLAVDRNHRRGELGYWIGPEHWGRGYATEAAGAVVRFGFEVLGLDRIQAMHMAGNTASGRVLEKLGMHPEGTLRSHVVKDGRRHDVVVRASLRSDPRPP